jgi:4-amino-4-deoxy-L-arabinose transferase-like glycosyltransferase
MDSTPAAPPPAAAGSPCCARPFLILAGLCLALWVPTCGLWDFAGQDECRYVAIAREWLDGGCRAVLTFHGEPYTEKPPLAFWTMAVFIAPSGPSTLEWLARLPSVLAATATVLLAFALARRLAGERAAWASALVLLATPLMLDLAPTARLDMPLTACMALAAFAWLGREGEGPIPWGRWLLLWGAVALGFLVKGPHAIIFGVAIVAGEAIAARSRRVFLDARPMAGLGLVLGAVLFWLGLQAAGAGFGFVKDLVWGGTVKRIAGDVHAKPFWYFALQFPLVLLPWTLLLVPAVRGRFRGGRDEAPRLGALAWGIALPLLLLSALSGKRVVYLLALMPPAAILVGTWIDRAAPRGEPLPRTSRIVAAALLLMAAALGTASAFAGDADVLARLPFPPPGGAVVGLRIAAAALAVVAVVLLLRPRTGDVLLGTGVAVVLAGALVNYVVVQPLAAASDSPKGLAAALAPLVEAPAGGGKPVLGAVGEAAAPRFHVYGPYAVRDIEGGKDVGAVFADPANLPSAILLVDERSPRIREAAAKAGYVPAWSGEAAGARLVLLRRGR